MGPEIPYPPPPPQIYMGPGIYHQIPYPPPRLVNRLIDTCENITFAQLLLRAVNIALFIFNLCNG